MPRTIATVEELRQYIRGIAARTRHHADGVEDVWMAIGGAVLTYKDANTPLEVRTYRNALANQVWVIMRQRRYTFSYNHDAASIELRRDTQQGPVVATFDNTTPLATIAATFRNLGRAVPDRR